MNARFLLALGLSVPEFPFPIEAFGRNPLDPARASGPIRATMPLFVAFPEAGAVSKRCLGSCQSAPEHVRPRLKAKSSKTLQSGTSGYTCGGRGRRKAHFQSSSTGCPRLSSEASVAGELEASAAGRLPRPTRLYGFALRFSLVKSYARQADSEREQ